MRQSVTWIGWLTQAVSLVGASAGVKAPTKFITLRRVVVYGAILPLLVCALVITVAALGFTALVARLSLGFIACLEKASTAFLSGRTRT